MFINPYHGDTFCPRAADAIRECLDQDALSSFPYFPKITEGLLLENRKYEGCGGLPAPIPVLGYPIKADRRADVFSIDSSVYDPWSSCLIFVNSKEPPIPGSFDSSYFRLLDPESEDLVPDYWDLFYQGWELDRLFRTCALRINLDNMLLVLRILLEEFKKVRNRVEGLAVRAESTSLKSEFLGKPEPAAFAWNEIPKLHQGKDIASSIGIIEQILWGCHENHTIRRDILLSINDYQMGEAAVLNHFVEKRSAVEDLLDAIEASKVN